MADDQDKQQDEQPLIPAHVIDPNAQALPFPAAQPAATPLVHPMAPVEVNLPFTPATTSHATTVPATQPQPLVPAHAPSTNGQPFNPATPITHAQAEEQVNPWAALNAKGKESGGVKGFFQRLGAGAGAGAEGLSKNYPAIAAERENAAERLQQQPLQWAAKEQQGQNIAFNQNAKERELSDTEGKNAAEETDRQRQLADAEKKTPSSPQGQTYDALLKQTNPATGKPYTEQEALAAVQTEKPDTANQDRERYEQITAEREMGKPIKPEDAAWAKAYEKAGTLGPQISAGAGTYQPLYGPDNNVVGFYDSKNPRQIIPAGALPGNTAQGNAATAKETDAFNKGYVDPANAIERSYDMFQDAYKAIQAGDAKTGAEDMLLLSQHLATTFGQVKGSRMNKDLIQEHKDAIGTQDKIERFANNLASGQQLSPDQRKEFDGLITNMRNLTWQIAAKEAVRRKQPIDFLPAGVEVKMKDSAGKVREVPGDRVQSYLDHGIQLGE
jgi:hypothetical protein